MVCGIRRPVRPDWRHGRELDDGSGRAGVPRYQRPRCRFARRGADSRLSAILLDETYYAFIIAGRREVGGLPWIGEDRLIPLKAVAWLDLNARKELGAKVGAKDVRKHLNDVLRLSQLLAPTTRIPLDKKIGDDMARFLTVVASDNSIDPKSLQLGNVTVAELVARIAQAYELDLPAQAME